MSKYKIKYVSKSKLFPAFGYATEKTQTAYIRKDLPKIVQKFLIEHELYHLKDFERHTKLNKKYNWFMGETRANLYALSKHPIGFLYTAILSLTPARIKLYINRFKEGK